MGKASKRHSTRHSGGPSGGQSGRQTGAGASTGTSASAQSGERPGPAPFVSRPFEGLAGETEWVALREIVPAATGTVRFAAGQAPEGAPAEATMSTVLPMAWPALRRNDGAVLVSTQAGPTCGDASRDIAAAWLLAAQASDGFPITQVPTATTAIPRLQQLLDPADEFVLTIQTSFDYWVGEAEVDESGRESIKRATDSIVPTVRVEGAPSVYWVDFGERTFVRWVLPHAEDAATNGLARLLAAGSAKLTDDSRLLGAFRACGLIVPVWEVPHGSTAASYAAPITALAPRLTEAIETTTSLTPEQRRARNGLLSRQVTLR